MKTAFLVLFVFATGFIVGQVSEDFRRADETQALLNMVDQARASIKLARARCFFKYPEQTVSAEPDTVMGRPIGIMR